MPTTAVQPGITPVSSPTTNPQFLQQKGQSGIYDYNPTSGQYQAIPNLLSWQELGGNQSNLTQVDNLSGYNIGSPLASKALLKMNGQNTVYQQDPTSMQLRAIPDMATLQAMGYNSGNIQNINSLSGYNIGQEVSPEEPFQQKEAENYAPYQKALQDELSGVSDRYNTELQQLQQQTEQQKTQQLGAERAKMGASGVRGLYEQGAENVLANQIQQGYNTAQQNLQTGQGQELNQINQNIAQLGTQQETAAQQALQAYQSQGATQWNEQFQQQQLASQQQLQQQQLAQTIANDEISRQYQQALINQANRA